MTPGYPPPATGLAALKNRPVRVVLRAPAGREIAGILVHIDAEGVCVADSRSRQFLPDGTWIPRDNVAHVDGLERI
jgi:hypothetical protein